MHSLCLKLLLCFSLLTAPLAVSADDYTSFVAEAVEARNRGDFPLAETLLRDAYQVANDKREAAYLLGLVLAFQEKFKESMVLLDSAIASYPEDDTLQLARARVMSYQGDYQASLKTTQQILAKNPANTEASNLAGRVNIYQKRWRDAGVHFDRVLRIEPDNLEAIIGQHDIALFSGDKDTAEVWLTRAETIAPGHADVITRRNRQTGVATSVHQLSIGWGASDISFSGFSNWYDRFIEYRHGAQGGNQQALRFQHAHRFGKHDSFLDLQLVYPDIPLLISVGAGIEQDFLPKWRISLGSYTTVLEGSEKLGAIIGHASYRHTVYETGTVRQLVFNLDYYYQHVNGWLSPAVMLTNDEQGKTSSGWSISTNHQLTPDWRVGFGYADAPETENNRTTDTKNYHVYTTYQFTPHWRARIDLSQNEREDSYTRRSAILSMSYQF